MKNTNKNKSSFDSGELILKPVSFLSAPGAAKEYDKAGKSEAPQEKEKLKLLQLQSLISEN